MLEKTHFYKLWWEMVFTFLMLQSKSMGLKSMFWIREKKSDVYFSCFSVQDSKTNSLLHVSG